MSGGDASDGLRDQWDTRYRNSGRRPSPARVLAENLHLLPDRGRALDLACGLGANALLLAEQGLRTSAWDLSAVAIERLAKESRRRRLVIDAQVRDVQSHPPGPGSFDVIVVSHFLDRALAPALAAALRPGGLLFYQSFTRESVGDCGPSNPEYRLAANELRWLFRHLRLRYYREEGRVGDLSRGTRDLALLVSQRVY